MRMTAKLNDQLKQVPPTVRLNVEAAIRVVKEAAPGAAEVAYDMAPPRSRGMMWKLVRYTAGGEPVVGIGTFTNHSALYFFRGVELDDGSGLLEGGGKLMRFITLRSPADAARPAVKRMVRKAFKHAAGD
jgi:Domain of unknown function (DU1801)